MHIMFLLKQNVYLIK